MERTDDISFETHRVLPFAKGFSKAAHLCTTAFPPEEQEPFALLVIAGLRPRTEFVSFFDKGDFCGIALLCHTEELVFVLYLAVSEKKRSCGYGTAIIDWAKHRWPDLPLALEIEPLDADADNYEQRRRRFGFYERCGFQMTDYDVIDDGVRYSVLYTGSDFDYRQLERAMSYISYGRFETEFKLRDGES